MTHVEYQTYLQYELPTHVEHHTLIQSEVLVLHNIRLVTLGIQLVSEFFSFFLMSNHFSFLLIFDECCIFTFIDMFLSFVSGKTEIFFTISVAVM